MFGRSSHRQRILVVLLSSAVALMLPRLSAANDFDEQETVALLNDLGKAKVSLADGVRQAAKNGEAPISAKFELDDDKKLSLSVYTAAKGVDVEPEHNVLKELSGSPEQASWSPNEEVFEDLPHVSRASEHLTLMALSRRPLADLIATAQKEHEGTVYSATPEVKGNRPVLIVLVNEQGRSKEYRYDLTTGQALR
jgi:hypothetical protein